MVHGAGAADEWPPLPKEFSVPPPTQTEYPEIPGFVGHLIEAITRRSGCSRPIAALAVLGSLSGLAAWDWDVQTLAPVPKPLSLNVFGISESTWRKSTAWQMVWQPHLDADEEIEVSWKAANAHHEGLQDSEKRDAFGPRATSPKFTRGDASVETMKSRLLTGRPCQVQFSEEAADLLKWAFQESRLASTLAFYNKTFDGSELSDDKLTIGREVSVRRYRHQLVLAGQSAVMMRIIGNPAAADGFAGRTLVAKDDVRPPRLVPPTDDDQEIVRRYAEAVVMHRRRQDRGLELEGTEWPPPGTLVFDPDALHHLQVFHDMMEKQTDMFHNLNQSQGGMCIWGIGRAAARVRVPAGFPASEVAFALAESDSLSSQEGAYHPQDLLHYSRSRLGCQACLPGAPGQALDVVGQHHAGDGASLREGYFKGVTFRCRCNRAE